MRHLLLLVMTTLLLSVAVQAQINVGSNQAPDSSAMLQISGNTKGFLPPRMTRDTMLLIRNPAKGLIVFNTTDSLLYMHRDSGWVAIYAGEKGWSLTGNSGTNYATNFLGTTDNKSMRFRTNNLQRMIMDSLGNAAIGADVFDAANPEKFLINAGNTNSVNGLVAKGSINNYFQFNVKNSSSGGNATSDIVATADNGTESTNYVDLGINGSGYTGSAIQTGVANDGYLISSGNDFYVVNSSANKNMLFLTGGTGVANERMRILANGRVGMGVQDPTAQFVVKDTMEIRRTGTLSQLLFTNTAGTGDLRIGGDGGDLYWQGGGSRNLQMGSYWTTVLGGDRQGQGGAYPAFANGTGGTGVLVQAQRDASVPFAVQGNSASQSANLTEWRNSGGTALNVINNIGNLGLGTTNPAYKLQVSSAANPLSLLGVQTGTNSDSILTISGSVVKKLSPSALAVSSSNAWSLLGNNNTALFGYFLGTTNSDPLIFKINSQPSGRLDANNTFFGYQSGYTNSILGNQNTGIGYHALYSNLLGTYNTALGYGSLQNNSLGSNNIGIGNNAGVANNSSNSIAVGTNSVVNYSNSIAVGTGAQANNTGAVGIGNNTYVNGLYGIAIGSGPNSPITQAFGNYSVALGYNSYGGTTNSIAIGTSSISNGNNGTALGNAASSASANSTAIGTSASVTGANSTAIGYNAVAATDNAVVLGDKSNTSVSVAIGSENFSNGNREKLLVDAGTTNSVNVISGKGNINSYLQLNIQNKSTGTSASSDVVATADNGDETTNYIDMGINSSTNSANYFGGANDAYLYTLGQNMLIGTAAASKSISFLTGGGTQSTNERMRIDGSGNVGIGTTSPSTKLHIVGTNPLTLTGVQTGTNTSADSLLTITGGLIRKLPVSTFASPANFWSTTGNASTNPSTNFIGTTDAQAFVIKQNSTQAARFETNSIAMGNGSILNGSTNSYAFGSNATIGNSKKNAFAIGNRSNVYSDSSYALGDSASITYNAVSALAIGNSAIANSNYAISIGKSALTGYSRISPVSIGAYAAVDGDNGVALGNAATVGSIVNSTALGALTSVTAANSTAIGYKASTTQANTVVIGDRSNISLAVGIGSEAFTFGNREKLLVDAGTGSYNVISGRGDLNNYLQLNIKNANAGGSASSDVVATADNGNETNNYIDMGINSSGNNANYFGGTNDAYLYNIGQNLLLGTGSASKSVVFLTGGGTQSSNERMRIDGSGNVGIGTNAPSTKLHIVGTNPLTLTGVQTGTNTSADSLLTITGGLVRKLPLSTFTTPSSAWSVNGNTGTTAGTNFIGTTDAQDLVFKANGTERMRIVNGTSSATGTAGDIVIGDANSGTIRTSKEVVMREDGDQFGSSVLRLRNRNGENGAIFETIGASNGAYLADFVFRTGASIATQVTSNLRFETRSASQQITGNTSEWQIGQPDVPTFVVGASAASSNSSFRIGNVGVGATTFNSSNPEKLLVNAGTTGNTDFQNVIVGKGNTNSYAQLNIQNSNAGTGASSDVVATADNGNESVNYIDMGINSSGNTANNFGGINDAYLYATGNGAGSQGGNLLIGTATPTKDIYFLTGGGTKSSGTTLNNERMRILGTGNVGIGVVAPTAALHLKAGAATAGNAPLKLTAGTSLSTPETGAVEFDGTNYFATSGTTRYTLAKTLTATQTLDFPNTSNGSVSTLTIAVTGARDGDAVALGVPGNSGGLVGTFSAYVSANDTVTVKFSNTSTSVGIDPVPGTFRVSILKY